MTVETVVTGETFVTRETVVTGVTVETVVIGEIIMISGVVYYNRVMDNILSLMASWQVLKFEYLPWSAKDSSSYRLYSYYKVCILVLLWRWQDVMRDLPAAHTFFVWYITGVTLSKSCR